MYLYKLAMREIDFYEEFSIRLSKYLDAYLAKDTQFAYSFNKSLDVMIKELEALLQTNIPFNNEYIPKLKLDILFAFKRNENITFVLFEAKYLNQLSLKDYSQLSGYLQVAKNIHIGILLLIRKKANKNNISNDFREIIRLGKLPMDWSQVDNLDKRVEKFRTGIMSYQPSNGIEWLDTNKLNGISNFEELCSQIDIILSM